MRNVERVCGSLHGKASRDMYMTILTSIFGRCKEKIKYYDLYIGRTSELRDHNTLSPLRLQNAKFVEIRDLFLYQIWTNKCTHLTLYMQIKGHTFSRIGTVVPYNTRNK